MSEAGATRASVPARIVLGEPEQTKWLSSGRFVRRLERAADLGQNPLAHGQDGPEGQPLRRIVSPPPLCPGHRLAECVLRDANRLRESLPVVRLTWRGHPGLVGVKR